MLPKTPEELVDERRKGCFQPTIQSTQGPKSRNMMLICNGPSTARQFQIAIKATAQYGSGYKPPSPYQLGNPLLEDAMKMTSTMREEHERAWKHYGCTLMSDGWTDRRGRHLINFLVNSPEGTYFLESVDASSEVHDAYMLADLLEKRIEDIGKDKVVQVVTDNGANYKAAAKLLMERIPSLFWSPCVAHCLDLMLEEIGKLKEFKKPSARARRVTTFIYRHGRILSTMREKTDALKALFYSEAWTSNKLAKTSAGMDVHAIVLSTEFWNSVEDCLRVSAPLLIVLRVVDGDEKLIMLEVVALMNHAKEKIKLSFAIQTKKTLMKKIMDIIEKCRVKQMDHPLHGAALYLNPGKLHPLITADDDATIGQLRGCFLEVLGRMIHTKKRNRLLHQRLNSIVFVSYTRKMKTRFQIRREKKGKSFNPLVIEEFNWDNEWADSSFVHRQGAHGSLGASSSLRGCNLRRNASSNHARPSSPSLVEDDFGSDDEEDEASQDPHDDADVTDCEDAPGPNGSNNGEDIEAAANIHDEFDDGY
uniref:DUF659 domain-containing protein n=1 Tax=Setaria italica TaxID=4555 RepID=K3ZMR1_SETIT